MPKHAITLKSVPPDVRAAIQEYRLRGKLYMVRVTPAHGIAYVMIDQKGDGQFRKQDNLESGLRVPQWVLLEF